MVGYIGVSYIAQFFAQGDLDFDRRRKRTFIPIIFDSATFAGSTMLLMGILEPAVLSLIGNTKPFLLVAGLAGVAYSFRALWPGD